MFDRALNTPLCYYVPSADSMLKVNKTGNNAEAYSGSCQTFVIESFAKGREIFSQEVYK